MATGLVDVTRVEDLRWHAEPVDEVALVLDTGATLELVEETIATLELVGIGSEELEIWVLDKISDVDAGFELDDETITSLELVASVTIDDDDNTTPALVAVELVLIFELVTVFAVEEALIELILAVVEASTEEDVLTTAPAVETADPLTPFGEATAHMTAGV